VRLRQCLKSIKKNIKKSIKNSPLAKEKENGTQ
jgi:hypothetical protein